VEKSVLQEETVQQAGESSKPDTTAAGFKFSDYYTKNVLIDKPQAYNVK